MTARRLVTLRPMGGALSWRIDRRAPVLVALLLPIVVALAVVSLLLGDAETSLPALFRALAGATTANGDLGFIVGELRLPRAVLAVLVGVALGLSGAVMQALTRNPLADPGILGINSGAALAAVCVIVVWREAPAWLLPWAAFGGAAVTTAFIYAFAWRGGMSPLRLILIGIGVAAFLGSLTTLATTFGRVSDVQRAFIWLSGSLYGRGWGEVGTLAAWTLALGPLVWLAAGRLDTLALGDESAVALGVRLEASRAFLLVLATGLAAAAVAAAGTLGFVGLVAPHLSRRLVGPLHGGLLPVAALMGGLLVLCADLVGRTVVAPAQLPAGLLTAILGAPYFMYLLWTRTKG